jgi:hypothetical protein
LLHPSFIEFKSAKEMMIALNYMYTAGLLFLVEQGSLAATVSLCWLVVVR